MAKRKGNTARPGWCTITVRVETDALAAKLARRLTQDDPTPGDVPKWKAVHLAIVSYLDQITTEAEN